LAAPKPDRIFTVKTVLSFQAIATPAGNRLKSPKTSPELIATLKASIVLGLYYMVFSIFANNSRRFMKIL